MKTVIERRFLTTKVEIRAASDGAGSTVRGYAAVYGSPSNTLRCSRGDFVEVIEPGFFDDVMQDDVRALFNHDENLVLARSNAGKGTLRLFSDATGLGYEFDAPDTTTGRDLAVSMKRGDIDASSFAFSLKTDGDAWERRSDGVLVRTLRKGGCAKLHDVSPVTYPAYPETEVSMRSLEQFLNMKTTDSKTAEKREYKIYNTDDYSCGEEGVSPDVAYACEALNAEIGEMHEAQEYLRDNPTGALKDYAEKEITESVEAAKMLLDFIAANGAKVNADATERGRKIVAEFRKAAPAAKENSQPPLDLWERRLASIRNNSR